MLKSCVPPGPCGSPLCDIATLLLAGSMLSRTVGYVLLDELCQTNFGHVIFGQTNPDFGQTNFGQTNFGREL